jgi:uncharacterized protein with HEPN domain
MSGARAIEDSARLAIIEQSAIVVVTFIDGLARDDLLRSMYTRTEVHRQLLRLAGGASGVSAQIREAMPEIDWDAWRFMQTRLALSPGAELDDALWFACESLVPATLLWLRMHRQRQGALFRMTM